MTNNQANTHPTRIADIPPRYRKYARKLDSDARDYMGALRPAGTVVLSMPGAGNPIFTYSRQNMLSEPGRTLDARILFPPREDLASESQRISDGIIGKCQDYVAKIDANFDPKAVKNRAFPDVSTALSIFQSLWGARISSSDVIESEEKKLKEDLISKLVADAVPSSSVKPSNEWMDEIGKSFSASIRRCSTMAWVPYPHRASVYVAEVFATPFSVDPDTGHCFFRRPDARFFDIVIKCVRERVAGLPRGKHLFVALGSGLPWNGEIPASSFAGESVVVSAPHETDGSWSVRMTSVYPRARPSLRDFLDRLMPLTNEDRFNAVKSLVDGQVFFRDSWTTAEVKDQLHESGAFSHFPKLRKTAIARAFIRLQNQDPEQYAVGYVSDDMSVADGSKYYLQLAKPGSTCPLSKKVGRRFHGARRIVLFLRYHSIRFASILLGIALWKCRDLFMEKLGLTSHEALGIVFIAVFMYIGSILQNWVNRFSTVEED